MAVYNLENYLEKDGLGFPLNFRRGNPNPLDNSSVQPSLTAAQNYAKTDATAYVGQILSVINKAEDNSLSVDVYKIVNEAGDLEKVGTSPIGDESTITVAEDGTVSLVGITGLALSREVAQEDGTKVTQDITYQPLLVKGKLTWVEPSATTVEGLAAEIEGIKGRLTTVEGLVGDENGGLVKDVADITSKLGEVPADKTVIALIDEAKKEVEGKIPTVPTNVSEFTNDAKYQTDTQVKSTVEAAIAEINHAVFQKVAEVPAVEDAADNVLYLVPGQDGKHHDIYAKINGEMVLIDDTDADLSGYAKTADIEEALGKAHEHANKALLDTYTQTEEDLADAVAKKHEHSNATILDAITEEKVAAWDEAEKNVVASVEESEFTVTDRKLAILAVAMSKVTGLTEEFQKYVAKQDGHRMLTPEEIIKLGKVVPSDELGAWLTNNRETVEGLLKAADAQKLAGIEAGAEVNDIVAITLGDNESAQTIVDRVVNIPVATAEKYGVVKASAEENKVGVAADGTMEVNSLNVNKLVQDEGTFLILDGGSAAG